MTRLFVAGGLALAVLWAASFDVDAHGFGTTPIWNREISRIIYDKCASCHRPGGSSFSLLTYVEAQPHAEQIKDAVLSRRMPPWGAVKGFGAFRNDSGLTQEQLELLTAWVIGGKPRGNNPRALPKQPTFTAVAPFNPPGDGVAVSGTVTLKERMIVDGLFPQHVPDGRSIQVVAEAPGGAVTPLLWLYEYKNAYRHPFLFRNPVPLPAGTVIRGVPAGATLVLLPTS